MGRSNCGDLVEGDREAGGEEEGGEDASGVLRKMRWSARGLHHGAAGRQDGVVRVASDRSRLADASRATFLDILYSWILCACAWVGCVFVKPGTHILRMVSP